MFMSFTLAWLETAAESLAASSSSLLLLLLPSPSPRASLLQQIVTFMTLTRDFHDPDTAGSERRGAAAAGGGGLFTLKVSARRPNR